MVTKRCRLCAIEKDITCFYRNAGMADGHLNHCKSCFLKNQRKRRKESPEILQAYNQSNRRKRARRRYAVSAHGREMRANAKKLYYQRHPKRHAARMAVYWAVKTGKIERPETCSRCGQKHDLIHGHHEDYSRRLDVIWVCPPCHIEIHNELAREPQE